MNCESYLISVVRPLNHTTAEERQQVIRDTKFNLFSIPSKKVTFDMLTDSGTGAISNQQLAEIITGDESYAGSESFEKLNQAITHITGLKYVIPTHQGRGAENVLCTSLLKSGDVIPGNTHFDTTKGHIEVRKGEAVDCTIDEAKDPTSLHPFKGNIDFEKLETVLKTNPKEKIPFVLITITCNSGGGQPVSLENIQAAKKMCHQYGVRLFLDMARFAENAYFIKRREAACREMPILEICQKMFEGVDGATMSGKKDGLVAMGGFVAFREKEIYDRCSAYSILYEGYLTYGGMTGGTMAAFAQGLKEVVDFEYLKTRVEQVDRFGAWLKKEEVPVMEPFGGHAVYVDAKRFLPHIPQPQFPAQALAVAAYVEEGIRGVEIGTVLADRDPKTRENRYPAVELVRLAVPRRTFTDNHLQHVAQSFGHLLKRRNSVKGLKIIWEAPVLRHFTCQFEEI